MKHHSFDKFINQEKNSRKKEAIRQEKRKWKEEKKKKYEERNDKHEIKKSGNKIQNTKFQTQNRDRFTDHNQPATGNRQPATEMPLNKFIAHAGICGRREAAELVKEGKIKVNNAIIYEPGFKVTSDDKIIFNGKQLHVQKNLVYILLNKPKDYITTAKDTHGRKTVFELIKGATGERVYSVGRLDRNTTGVLLLTNDGELTQKLTHPSFEVKKIYEVKLDKPLHKKDMESILQGIELEDGFIAADTVGYADSKDRSLIGMEIHSGRNRIVRRIFEHFGYIVKSLDRVLFANLTKKNIERGKWRFLKEKEVRLLKYMNQSFVKKS
ncbi:MAG TPA: pseudouridine synthase [Parafilimonas sp.]|nr:pseudouridine synthase [Parafilimonas sp.]